MTLTARAPVRIDFGGAWTDVDIFAHTHGGAVFNATINQYIAGSFTAHEKGQGTAAREGLQVTYGFDLPSGSGLGTSGALNVIWLGLVGRRISDLDRIEIAERAYRLEELLGILGGRQDQYAAALGGFNLLRFGQSVAVEPVAIPKETVAELEARSVLVYTGKLRLSGAIHENVWGAYRAGRPETLDALHRLHALALEMPPLLQAGRIDDFADRITANWAQQRRLDDSVTNAQIEGLFRAAQAAGARGGKACGAGGGGCLYFIAEEGKREAVAQALADAGARLIPFAFEFEGLTLTTTV